MKLGERERKEKIKGRKKREKEKGRKKGRREGMKIIISKHLNPKWRPPANISVM